MAKLYFKYGVMGSSKSAQALMCKFNYEQAGFKVLLLKSSLDDRDINNQEIIIRSRIGLQSKCFTFTKKDNLIKLFKKLCKDNAYNVIIVDECQFASEQQINQLKELSVKVPVLCYGLLTDFKTKLFPGSKRLVEISDSLMEIKYVCDCGRKAGVNARFVDGKLCTTGDVVAIEKGEITYKAMCHSCYMKLKNKKDNSK